MHSLPQGKARVRQGRRRWLERWRIDATTYQARPGQAEKTTITQTPAGDPVDLSALIQGEAVLQLAPPISNAALLTDSLDASIIDERDPFRRNPDLDLYG
ncbi:hypothetical protein ACIO93_36045 [Streptomyces sp. NPDC087903]|uniref:hypothetical protein n=1 Tax=Streptomyces sp. NPDC087903 TaxID=3365819 RepID=UPI0037FF25D9